jgi:anaerobic ribonucleoside-triphosphate reductase
VITVQKRDGQVVPFEYEKIERAIVKASAAAGTSPHATLTTNLSSIVDAVTDAIRRLTVPVSVETIQDAVERALLAFSSRNVI